MPDWTDCLPFEFGVVPHPFARARVMATLPKRTEIRRRPGRPRGTQNLSQTRAVLVLGLTASRRGITRQRVGFQRLRHGSADDLAKP
jgi:hypothetical protein